MLRSALAIGLTALLGACYGAKGSHAITLTSRDKEKTVNLQVEIADTPEARRIGLMNRTDLPTNQGMLFAFEEPELLRFWMQDTLIPLDIIFFDSSGTFVNAYTMEPCADQDPCPTYNSAEPARFALEVPAGFRQAQGIGVGWSLNMQQVQRIVDFE